MFIFKNGNIFEQDVEAIVNPVNCVGVMGAGLALQFKNRFPENFKFYKDTCNLGELDTGKLLVFDYSKEGNNDNTSLKYIINFPTKKHWANPSQLEYVEAGLKALKDTIKNYAIKSIAMPPLGCGLGGLKWEDVCQLILDILIELEFCKIIVLKPKE